MFTKPDWLIALTILVVGATMMPASWAQDYPSRPVKIVVPNTPGTLYDVIARALGPEMSKVLGQPIVVENRPGAAQIIGYEYVAKAPPDGYTLIAGLSSELAILPLVSSNLRFNPLKDLPPVAGIAEATLVFGSSSSKPWKSVSELVAYAKANPGKLNYGSSSPGILLPMLALVQGYGIDAVNVPYNGGGPFVLAVISGEADMGFMPESNAITGGDRFRALAVTSPERLASFPDTPTFAELGTLKIPSNSYTINAPAGTPKAVIARLQAAITTALKQPEVRTQLERSRLRIVELTPEAAAESLAERARIYADIAKRAGIPPK